MFNRRHLRSVLMAGLRMDPKLDTVAQCDNHSEVSNDLPSVPRIVMQNTLIELIHAGKIRSVADLKRVYHRLLFRTHPDATASIDFVEQYLEIRRQYVEAEKHFANPEGNRTRELAAIEANHQLEFFRHWDIIETLEMPYTFQADKNRSTLQAAKQAARTELVAWKPEWEELYKSAEDESARAKLGIPLGPYRKHAIGLNIRPVVHNIIYFHLTGRSIYRRQAKQNLQAVMHRLQEEGFPNLKKFVTLLVEDMKNGSAIFR